MASDRAHRTLTRLRGMRDRLLAEVQAKEQESTQKFERKLVNQQLTEPCTCQSTGVCAVCLAWSRRMAETMRPNGETENG